MPRSRKPASPFRYFNSSPEVIGLVVLRGFRQWRWHIDEMYVKLNGEMDDCTDLQPCGRLFVRSTHTCKHLRRPAREAAKRNERILRTHYALVKA